MKLKTSANHALKTPIETLDSNGNWVHWTDGRFSTVDRFLSNFHRPIQRRSLVTDPDVPLPETWVIRNALTQEMYLLGQSRHDTDDTQAYVRLSICHFITESVPIEFTLHRKVVDQARDQFNIGELIDSTIGTFYGAFEHKQTSESYNAEDHFLTKFLFFFPHGSDVVQGDTVIASDGREFQVEGSYHDSYFQSFVAQEKPDDRETGEYLVPTVNYGYDVATGVVNKEYDRYKFTCEKASYKADKGLAGDTYDVEIYVKTPSLPVKPEIGFKVVVSGKAYLIQRIEKNFEAGFQTRLLCVEHTI